MGKRENGGGTGGIVVGAVVDGVAAARCCYAKMIKMGRQQNDLIGCGAAAKNADGIPCLLARNVFELREVLLKAWRQRIRQRGLLDERSAISSGCQAERLELRSCEESGNVFIACSGAATVQFVGGQKIHVGTDLFFQRRQNRCRFRPWGVE